MRIEDTAASNRTGRRGLAEDEAVARNEHTWLGKLDAHQPSSSRLDCFISVEGDTRHGLRSEGVEVNACSMLQR